MVWALLDGEDKSGSERGDEYEMVEGDEDDDDDDMDEDLEIVSWYCLLTA